MNSLCRGFSLFILSTAAAASIRAADRVDYVRDVKPLLKRCNACHGALRQQSSLRLDTAAFIRQGGESGPGIVSGKSAESLIVQALLGINGVSQMPPDGDAPRLTEAEIAKVKVWIDQGAQAPEEPIPTDPRRHWSFQKPSKAAVPVIADAAWVRNPIDAFVAAEHERLGLRHSGEANPSTLLRRVYLDLIGLPPTREELQSFLADPSPDAYEKVVAKLLASDRYGERWGRHWMDVWRYSDWAGYGQEIRESQYHIWRWRDWIVESLNTDRPYDQMIVEMLAGDEIAPQDPNVLRATGYLGRSWFKFNRNVWLDNVVEHSSKAFVGLTINCARCHDHKYDPIAQTDYYRWRAIFEAHETRYDRIPGQADVVKSGIARAFDKNPESPTYLFVRGNEQQPDKEHPLTPGVPGVFGATFEPQPIPLPVESYYPALSGFVVEESRAKAKGDVSQAEGAETKANEELAAARKRLAELSAATGAPSAATATGNENENENENEKPAEAKQAAEIEVARRAAAVALAIKKRTSAAADLASFEARLAAERAKFGLETNVDANALANLAQTAHRAERLAAVEKQELQLLESEQQVAAAQAAEKPMDEKSKKTVTDAQTKREAAAKALEAARKEAESSGQQYAALGDVYPPSSTGRRIALARWIAARDNPLTARVAVNHIWMRHFGTPLVPTVFDFGLNGKPPTHPGLLDWLAVEFMENGWCMKHVHQLIVCSSTYRQASVERKAGTSEPNPALVGPPASSADPRLAIDPDNRFLWRMNVRRLEAEIVRDSVLYVAGNLDSTFGGPDIDQNQGQTVARRSIYFRHAKEKEMVFTKLFDGPGVAECYRRDESIVPQQALALANSPLVKTQSRVLATKLGKSCGRDDTAEANDRFIAAAFEQVLSRLPTEKEFAICREFLASQSRLLADPAKLTAATAGEAAAQAPAKEPYLHARENLVHVLLNHNDFITVR